MNLESIPEDLRKLNQFVCWDLISGRKVPINPHDGSYAKANDSSTWGSFDQCFDRVSRNLNRGIGFEFSESDQFCGIDFDHCLEDGKFIDDITRAFFMILWRSKTYCEISQSGNGLHVIVKNTVPDEILRTNKGGRKFSEFCEIYQSSRFFALTGDLFHSMTKSPRVRSIESRLWKRCLKILDAGDFQKFIDLSDPKRSSDPISQRLESDSLFRAAYNGDSSRWDNDKSDRDIYVMSQLLKMLGDRSEVLSAFQMSPCGSDLQRKVGHVQDYLDRTFDCAQRNLNSSTSTFTSSKRSVSEKKNENSMNSTLDYRCTDLENGRKLSLKCRKSVRYCCKLDQFYRWCYGSESSCWSSIDPVSLYDLCQLVSDDLDQDARQSPDKDLQKRLFAGSRMMLMNSSCDRAIQRLKSFPEFFVEVEDLDSASMIVPCRNQYFNLDTAELIDPSPEYLFTRNFDVQLDPSAESSDWNDFLESSLPDLDVRRELQKFMGYCLSGDTSFERFLYIYGHGGNGKGTFLSACLSVFGSFGISFPITLLNDSKFKDGESPSPILASLRSVRLAVSDEVNADSINVAFLKSITGGDRIIARSLRKDPVEFTPQFKLILVGNERLSFGSSNDDGLSRRLLYIPFDNVPPTIDITLKRRLQSPKNRSAILNWMIEGYQLLKSEGFVESESMKSGKDALLSLDDQVSSFIAEYCIFDESLSIKVSEFVSRYQSETQSNEKRGSIVRAVLSDRRITLIRPGNIQTFKGVGWSA